MPNRLIKDSINESRGLTSCSLFAQDLYKRLITYADDYGRFNADPQIMLARLYPRELAVITVTDLIDGLVELTGAGKIGFYTAEARKDIYGAFPNWKDHQRIRDSKKKAPDPEDTSVNDWYLKRFIPMETKIAVIERDKFKCQICGKHLSCIDDAKRFAKLGTGLFHIDHEVPVLQGGRATLENLRLTCPACNLTRKKVFSYEEILDFSATRRNSPQLAATRRLNPIQSNPNPNPESKEDEEDARAREGWERFAVDYERNIGSLPVTEIEREDLTMFFDEFGPDALHEFIAATARKHPDNPHVYFTTICRKNLGKGICTADAAKAALMDYDRQKGGRRDAGSGGNADGSPRRIFDGQTIV